LHIDYQRRSSSVHHRICISSATDRVFAWFQEQLHYIARVNSPAILGAPGVAEAALRGKSLDPPSTEAQIESQLRFSPERLRICISSATDQVLARFQEQETSLYCQGQLSCNSGRARGRKSDVVRCVLICCRSKCESALNIARRRSVFGSAYLWAQIEY